MAATNFTPISLYYSTTAAATPSAGNLVAGELALNTVDEKLYFKNSAGTVKLLASNATSAPVTTFSAGSTGLTPSSATAGAVTLAGTLAVANGGTGLTAGTSGGVLAYTAAGTLASSAALAASALVIGGGAGAAPSTTTTGTGVVTALGVNTGSAGAFVVNGGALGTPASGTVTNLTGTASININGTVGATTPAAGSFTTVSASGAITGGAITGTRLTVTQATDAVIKVESTVANQNANFTSKTSVQEWRIGGNLSDSSSGALEFYDATSPGTKARITSTGLNSTVIGATTPAAGSFTTLSAGDNLILYSGSSTSPAKAAIRASSTGTLLLSSYGASSTFINYDNASAVNTYIYSGGALVSAFSSTGLAVTGTLSATGAAAFKNVSTTFGDGAGVGNSGAKTIYNGWNSGGSNWQIDTAILGGNTDLSFTPSSVAGGLTFTTPVVQMKTTGLAVTGTLSATGTTTVGVGGTGAADGIVVLNGSSASNQGAYINFKKNSVDKIYIGTGSSVIGGTLDSLCLSALVGAVTTYANGTKVSDVDKDKSLALQGATSQTGTGITFPATQNASANANTLDDYDEYTATSAACTGAITTAAVWKLTKVGNMVTLTLPAVTGTASAAANITFGTALPAKYRPVAEVIAYSIPLQNNNAVIAAPGIASISSSGVITVYRDLTGSTNFTGSAGAGVQTATSVSWTI